MLPTRSFDPDWEVHAAALRAFQVWKGLVTSTTPTTVYTVPAGKRLILKSVTGLNGSSGSRDLQLRIAGVGTVLHWNLAVYGTGGDTSLWIGWMVLDAGDAIQLDLGASGTVSVTLSGSLHDV